MVVMTVLVIVKMPVVVAGFGRPGQLAAEVCGHERFDWGVRRSRSHCDAVMREVGQRAMPYAARYDQLHSSFAQPAGKQARLMSGRGNNLGAQCNLLVLVHFDQSELAAAAEVTVQTSVFNRDGNFHGSFQSALFFLIE